MKATINIRRIGEDYCLVIPKEAIELVGWEEDQSLELRADKTGIEVFEVKTTPDDEMEEQLAAARILMRKYHGVFAKLADS